MKRGLQSLSILTLLTFLFSVTAVVRGQIVAYGVTDRQVQAVIDQIEMRTNSFSTEIGRISDQSVYNGGRRNESISTLVGNFETSTDRLRDNFASRRLTTSDLQSVLNNAVTVDNFMRNNSTSPAARTQWAQIRADLNTLAGYYRLRANWTTGTAYPQGQGGYVDETQVRTMIGQLRVHESAFRLSFDRWSSRNRRNRNWSDTNISQHINQFETAMFNLNRNYRNIRADSLQTILQPSVPINSFVVSNPTNADILNKWNLVRNDLNALANYYNVSWNWDNTVIPNNTGYPGVVVPTERYGRFDQMLTGTYRLNTSRSDDVTAAVDRAVLEASYSVDQRDRARQVLTRRLTSPQILTIEKRGTQLTISSANAPQVVLTADGVARTETSPNGRSVRTRITSTNRDLTINYEGDRMNDYFVTFTPMADGDLRVTRRIFLENQNKTVTVTSLYDKTSPTPQWNTTGYTYNPNPYPNTYPTTGTYINSFLVPNNTSMTATLDNALSTRSASNGDRFSMTVTSPSRYSGAVIEGTVVGQRSAVVSGNANMTLNFDTIRMPDGRTYRFAGIVDQVRQPNGDMVTVNNEGTVRDTSQTTRTVERAGAGALLGAIIGAIAGGGQGAAIGAAVGAGAGAGSVILQGRDNLDLPSGSQFNITATAPSSVGAN